MLAAAAHEPCPVLTGAKSVFPFENLPARRVSVIRKSWSRHQFPSCIARAGRSHICQTLSLLDATHTRPSSGLRRLGFRLQRRRVTGLTSCFCANAISRPACRAMPETFAFEVKCLAEAGRKSTPRSDESDRGARKCGERSRCRSSVAFLIEEYKAVLAARKYHLRKISIVGLASFAALLTSCVEWIRGQKLLEVFKLGWICCVSDNVLGPHVPYCRQPPAPKVHTRRSPASERPRRKEGEQVRWRRVAPHLC